MRIECFINLKDGLLNHRRQIRADVISALIIRSTWEISLWKILKDLIFL